MRRLPLLLPIANGWLRRNGLQVISEDNLGSRAAVVRRSEGTRFSSPNDDEVGGLDADLSEPS